VITWAEALLEYPRNKDSFPGIAHGEDQSACEVAVAQQIGRDRR
jgi:hypothetical protein